MSTTKAAAYRFTVESYALSGGPVLVEHFTNPFEAIERAAAIKKSEGLALKRVFNEEGAEIQISEDECNKLSIALNSYSTLNSWLYLYLAGNKPVEPVALLLRNTINDLEELSRAIVKKHNLPKDLLE